MPLPNQDSDQQVVPPVRRADVKTWLTYEEMSPLGRRLMDIAREVEASDEPAMSEADLERELARRRGGYAEDAE
ncbi:MAG: hypothetical protein IPM66_22050 [Acidobacteriota bacterium]|nr:MAG: hypothetical protein IPM66_22050 [Acidobacteriota bacterium]